MPRMSLLPGLLATLATSASGSTLYLRFSPINGGWDRACSNSYWSESPYLPVKEGFLYWSLAHVPSIFTCMSYCGPSCSGIEYSDGALCRLWGFPPLGLYGQRTETVGVYASGKTCLKSNWGGVQFSPVDMGYNRACRGANPTDNLPSYYHVKNNQTYFGCLETCMRFEGCRGVEYHGGGEAKGRCELWTKAIRATASCSSCSNYWCFTMDTQWMGSQSNAIPSAGTPILP